MRNVAGRVITLPGLLRTSLLRTTSAARRLPPWTFSLCFRMTLFGKHARDFGVDLPADQNRDAGYVKPEQQDHDRTQRAVGRAVAVEEVQVNAQRERGDQPDEDAQRRSRRNPLPFRVLKVGRE